jgi:regulator of sirC expression with transglutaminase-like and TPR domain
MSRRGPWLVFLLALSGCPAQPPPFAPGPLARSLLDLADRSARDLSLPRTDREATLAHLGRINARARQAIAGKTGVARVEALNGLLFDEIRLERRVDSSAVELMLLPRVVARRQGSCLGLSALYLALGEALRLPLAGVLAPEHFFVRYDDGQTTRGIEPLERGRQMPRAWYVKKYQVPRGNPLYLRALSSAETLAVFRFNLANELRQRRRYAEALRLYRGVVQRLPAFAEAQANLALTHQLLGDEHAARAAYLRARQANPGLEGIEQNLARLR